MAAPHVTGAVALFAAAHPGASAAQIRAALVSSAAPTDALVGKTVTGGRLDIARTVQPQ
jgi:subtilisin family serine protease